MSSIVAEASDYFQVFFDGAVKCFDPPIVAASSKLNNEYIFKYVTVDPTKPIYARIFLPETANSTALLPVSVSVYFHGGGFCIGSTTWCGYHHFFSDLSVISQCIVVSNDYRLAPEKRLHIAYDDCYSSLYWLSLHVYTDPLLKQADLSRVFLSGDNAGGNIVHNPYNDSSKKSRDIVYL